MSHYSLVRIKIKNPIVDLLKQTVEEFAKEFNGEIVSQIKDYGGNVRSDFLIAIKTSEMHRGVGVEIDSHGNVQLVGDFYGYRDVVRNFEKMLVQRYTANATALALKNMGYNVEMQKSKQVVFIRAIEW